MRALIVGSTGLIGLEMLKTRPSDVLVRVTERESGSSPAEVDTVQWDAADARALDPLVAGVDCVIYLAQSSKFRSLPEGLNDVLDVNAMVPTKLAAAAVRNGVRTFLYVSTGSVYAETEERITETSPLLGPGYTNLYSASKISAEHLIGMFRDMICVKIARPFFVYGPGQRKDFLIPSLLDRILRGQPIYLDGENGLIFNPIYVRDASRVLWAMAAGQSDSLLNLSGPGIVSLRQVGESIGELVGHKPLFQSTGRPEKRFVACHRRMEQYGGQPMITVADGLRLMIKG